MCSRADMRSVRNLAKPSFRFVGRGLVSRRRKQPKSHETAGVNPRPTVKLHVHGLREHFVELENNKMRRSLFGDFIRNDVMYYFT